MLVAIALWLVSRQTGWNLPAYPQGTWYFNPFAWQVLFVFGAWCALGAPQEPGHHQLADHAVFLHRLHDPGACHDHGRKFPSFGEMFPQWLYSMFNPNDKTNWRPIASCTSW